MPRRRALTREQLEVLLALPATETELIRHWTLGAADLTAIERRRGDPKPARFRAATLRVPLPGPPVAPARGDPGAGAWFCCRPTRCCSRCTRHLRRACVDASRAAWRFARGVRLPHVCSGASCGRGCSPWRSGIWTL